MPGEPLSDWVTQQLAERSDELMRWVLAWARMLPVVLLVPAFGLRLLPVPLRVVMALALAVAVAPAVSPAEPASVWPVALLGEMARGLPVAISAATALYVATMAGGVIDHVRSPGLAPGLTPLEGEATPLGTLLSLLIALLFLEGGGASGVALAISEAAPAVDEPLRAALLALARGIGVAVAVAAPVVVVAILVDVVFALIHRTTLPASAEAVTATLRPLVLLTVAAVALDRMAAVLAENALRF